MCYDYIIVDMELNKGVLSSFSLTRRYVGIRGLWKREKNSWEYNRYTVVSQLFQAFLVNTTQEVPITARGRLTLPNLRPE